MQSILLCLFLLDVPVNSHTVSSDHLRSAAKLLSSATSLPIFSPTLFPSFSCNLFCSFSSPPFPLLYSPPLKYERSAGCNVERHGITSISIMDELLIYNYCISLTQRPFKGESCIYLMYAFLSCFNLLPLLHLLLVVAMLRLLQSQFSSGHPLSFSVFRF